MYRHNLSNPLHHIFVTTGLSVFCAMTLAAAAWSSDEMNSSFDTGYIAHDGKTIIGLKHGAVTAHFSGGFTIYSELFSGEYNFMDKNGVVLMPNFKLLREYSEDLAGAGSCHKMGFIDNQRKYVIAPSFEDVFYFQDGLAPVLRNRKYGFIDKSGAFVVSPIYEAATCFSEELAAVKYEGKIGFIDKSGSWQIKPQFDYAEGFREGLALVGLGENEFFIDRKGRVILSRDRVPDINIVQGTDLSRTTLRVLGEPPLQGFQVWFQRSDGFFSEGLVSTATNSKYGYIDKTGAVIIPAKFDEAFPFNNGIARVKVENKYGFINKSGSFVVEPSYFNACDFHEGVAAVRIDVNAWGYIDTSGHLAIAQQFSRARSFSEGVAQVDF